MQHSHTPAPSAETAAADRDRLWLVGATALGLDERLAGRLDGHPARFAEHMREGLLAASVAVGLDVMAELMEAEVTDLAGPKGKHNPARTAKRHTSEHPTVTLGGRRIGVRRPRVRAVGDHERELPVTSSASFTSADLLADGVVARMLGGLSTRGYPVGLEPVGVRVEQTATGTSHSAVSRRFVTAAWIPSVGCCSSSTAARPWPPRSAAPSGLRRCSNDAAGTRNVTSSTTSLRLGGPWASGGCARPGRPLTPTKPSTSWKPSRPASLPSVPVLPRACARA
jgi:hypothetical protein